jgi:FkbM family methyltransferase
MQHSNNSCALKFSFMSYIKSLYRRSLKKYISKQLPRFEFYSPSYAQKQRIFDREKNQHIGVSIRNKIDFFVMHQIFGSEDYSLKHFANAEDITAQYHACIANGITPLILDIGANIGLASVYFATEYPAAKIIAVEPDQNNFAQAQKNTADYNQVILINAGISCEDGKGQIINADASNWAFRTELSETGELAMISVNTILKEYASQNHAFLIAKIDIEGFESILFSKHTEWVDQFSLIVIELHDWMLPFSASSHHFLKCISQFKRDFVFRGENVFSFKIS